MKNRIKTVRQSLKDNADEKTQLGSKRFFKEPIKLYGVKSQTVHQIAKEQLADLNGVSKDEVFALCEPLWKSGYLEEIGIVYVFPIVISIAFIVLSFFCSRFSVGGCSATFAEPGFYLPAPNLL
jgi:3-methyladenine DNA glycosylase AlkD